MIEFKAKCGHTVRVEDAEAGDLARCTTCGRMTPVPMVPDDKPEYLFNQVQQVESQATETRKARRRRLAAGRRSGTPKRQSDPLGVVLRMCYFTACIIIMIVVGSKWLLPMIRDGDPLDGGASTENTHVDSDATTRYQGLRGRQNSRGMFIASTPPGATVYCVAESAAPPQGRIHQAAGRIRTTAQGRRIPNLPDDDYAVEVVFPWNHPSLSNPDLPHHTSYREFRRSLLQATGPDRNQLVRDYFLPDEADAVFVDETQEQVFLVRQYRKVPVRHGRSQGVRALFLPQLSSSEQQTFSIDKLVSRYLPKERVYGFDDTHVLNELDFYEIPRAQRPTYVEALHRIGVVPYRTPQGRTLLFKIDIDDGSFAARVISKEEP